MRRNHGTLYDLNAARLALIMSRDEVARRILAAVPDRRIALQIEPDGTQPMELWRTNSVSCSRLNITGLAGAHG